MQNPLPNRQVFGLDFDKTPAYKKLKRWALHPIDLTKEENFTQERLSSYVSESCGYRFLYGTERVTKQVIEALIELSKERHVMEKMRGMQAGSISNFIENYPSENRAVLHTATRDFFDEPQKSKQAVEATKLCKQEIDKLKKFMSMIDKNNEFTDLVSIGIGGSDLGPRAHFIALQYLLKKGRQIHFISNVDPDEATLVLKNLDLSKTLVVVVSKTGSTLETQANEAFVRDHFLKASIDPKKHFISVTSKGSPMDDREYYLESFYIWDWIGGRYSTTSMVGGVMLSFAFGFDLYWDFLRGANAMDKRALDEGIDKNLPLLGALLTIWNRNFLNYSTLAIIPYSQALSRYSAHIQQLEMESNGKHVDQKGHCVDFQTGPIIWGEPGTNAQHSFYQLIHQGTESVPIEFIGYQFSQSGEDSLFQGSSLQEKLLSNLIAQGLALATGKLSDNPNQQFTGNRPSHTLLAKQLTPYTLGVLLAYFEHKVAFEGFLWGINSFDQEGVQLGKVLASRVLDQFSENKKGQKIVSYPLGNAFIEQIKKL